MMMIDLRLTAAQMKAVLRGLQAIHEASTLQEIRRQIRAQKPQTEEELSAERRALYGDDITVSE